MHTYSLKKGMAYKIAQKRGKIKIVRQLSAILIMKPWYPQMTQIFADKPKICVHLRKSVDKAFRNGIAGQLFILN